MKRFLDIKKTVPLKKIAETVSKNRKKLGKRAEYRA